MTPFESSCTAEADAPAPPQASEVPEQLRDTPEWDDTAWGFYDSSTALREGLDVTEHAVPAALLGLLQDMSRPETTPA